MKTFGLVMVFPLVLAACGSPQFASEELRMLKVSCAGGNYDVCSDIGHKVRRASAEQAYLAKAQ